MDATQLDFEQVSAELLRALRGRRSQEAFARRIGSRSHTIYTWESGRNFPTAARMFEVAALSGVDLPAALRRFYRRPPGILHDLDVTTPPGVARLLDNLRGTTTIQAVASTAGRSRYAISRWLQAKAQPRVPDFLRVVEAVSRRAVDFVTCLVDPEDLPSVASQFRALEAMRKAAYDLPWSHAFLRALELADYVRLPRHEPGWLARRLGLPEEMEAQCLRLLEDGGQIALQDGHYQPVGVGLVDTGRDPAGARRLRLFFSQAATTRLQTAPGPTASSAYNLFGISRADLERLRDLQRAYFRQMRAIIAESSPVEAIVLANMQLVELADAGDADGAPTD
ncbi:MAG: DUF4423 domain-containing protein [Myxococcales bacterium]|nr:DUF4423 domain-containing protein [Myxococcales bacterium]